MCKLRMIRNSNSNTHTLLYAWFAKRMVGGFALHEQDADMSGFLTKL